MKRYLVPLTLILFVVFVVGYVVRRNIRLQNLPETTTTEESTPYPVPSAAPEQNQATPEQAETVGYDFVLDYIQAAEQPDDTSARQRAYDSLSTAAQSQMTEERTVTDLQSFLQLQAPPTFGASVEDLRVKDTTATLLVGLNYSAARELRALHLVQESGTWKIDSVTVHNEKSL